MKRFIQIAALTLSFSLATHILADGQSTPIRTSCPACEATLLSGAESDFDADTLDSPAKVFHHYGVHSHPEAYLVCVFKVEKTGGSKNEMKIAATVVGRINGGGKVGDTFVFRRISDSSAEEVSRAIAKMPGRLYYVFLTQWEEGIVGVDAQDPIALWGYTEELREVVESHKRRCQPDGATNGSQPSRSETNRTSPAAGCRR